MRYLKNEKLLVVIIVYLFVTTNLIILNSTLYNNLINPLFWCCIIAYLIWDCRKNYVRFNKNKKYLKYMIIISCMNVIIYLYWGFIFGFLEKTYNYEIILSLIPIIGIEIARSVIVARNKNNKLVLIFVTILFILVEIKYNTLVSLYPNREEFFKYICWAILPLIACSSLYTYLTLQGSFSLPLVYRISNLLVALLLPKLRNMDWFIIATTGILSPALIYGLFKYKFVKEKEDIRKRKENAYSKIIFVVTLILSINLVCFMIGLFQYEPITILSSSMIPSFNRGDVVIFKKMSDSELKEIPLNEVIIYSIGEQNIVHRVIDKIEQDDTVFYKTKGDSNNLPDRNLVRIEQIQGIYIFHIKYIGFPSVWLYEYFNK